ncbi:hypothetical protein [Actinomadura flavalba]|uniref:hypothetical protein n=1 Tax=Actinomadura flavalba TaxID=1120938 RepID=UPI0003A7C750|nr:hypothetical protein [Actinomadura flavalba]
MAMLLLPAVLFGATACGGASASGETVIAVRKDGHKITRAEFLKASADSKKRPKATAEKDCGNIKTALTKAGGKIADDKAWTDTCTEALSNEK